jgi:hypothetical protein
VRLLAIHGPPACTHSAATAYTTTDILELSTTAPPYIYILLSATSKVDLEVATLLRRTGGPL